MSVQPQLFRITSVFAALLLMLSGCGGDGKNTSDNTPSGATQGVATGPGTITPVTLTKAGAPLEIDDEDLGDVAGHTAVVDSSGNVMVIWTQDNGTQVNLWKRRYDKGSESWGTATIIDTGSGDVGPARLVVDSAGNMMAVWTQDTVVTGAVRTDLFAAHYTAGGIWAAPKEIDNGNLSAVATDGVQDIGSYEVVVDSSDVITVVWSQHDGSTLHMYANRYSGGPNWDGVSAALNSNTVKSVKVPKLVLDGNDNLFVTWTQDSSGASAYKDLWVNRYNDGGSVWGGAVKLDTEDVNHKGVDVLPQLVTDAVGNAMAVWVQSDNSIDNLWANRYDFGTGLWDGAGLIEAGSGVVSPAQLVVTGIDDFHVVWSQDDTAIDVTNLWANHYSGSWSGAATIESDNDGSVGSANLLVDSVGNITAVWIQGDGTNYNLWSNRYSGGWGTAAEIESTDNGDVTSASVLIDGTGRVTAVWLQEAANGLFDLWSNRASAAGAWGTAELIETLDNGSAFDPGLILDGATEDVTVVWREKVTFEIQLLTSKYDVSSSAWTTVTELEASGNDSGSGAKLVVDSSGTVTVLWLHQDTSGAASRFDLWANRI